MNIAHLASPDEKPYLIATMFNPAIVWDTSRLAIAKKMTDGERTAIAKRATGILRDSMPEILSVLSTYETARSRFAQSTILQKLEKENLLNTNEAKQSAKARRSAEHNLQNIDLVTEKYRTQSGYRMSCLCLLMPESEDSDKALAALSDMHLLNATQHTFFQGLLLEDLVRWNNYHAQAKSEYDAEKSNAQYVKKLRSRSTSISDVLHTIQSPIDGRPLSHYLNDGRLNNPVLNGTDMSNPVVTATAEFSLLKDCFKRINELLSTQIVDLTNEVVLSSENQSLGLLRES